MFQNFLKKCLDGDKMEEIKKFKTLVDEEKMLDAFYPEHKKNNYSSLLYYATDTCGMDGLIAAAHFFTPEIVSCKGYIFIKEFLNCDSDEKILKTVEDLEKQYNYDRKMIEMSVNSWGVGDFFLGHSEDIYDNEEVIYQFAECMAYFWKKRIDEVLPGNKVVVEIGEEIMGEYGISITFYQKD